MIPTIAVLGTTKSGKTTLIEYLISNLSKEGFRIGTIKHIHESGFSIDVKGKDTWRHAKAGAKIVVGAAPNELVVIRKKETSENELEEIIDRIKDTQLDLLIIEGFHSVVGQRKDIPKIVTAKTEEELRRTLSKTVAPVLAITGSFAKLKTVPAGVKTPIIDIRTEGKKILAIVQKVFVKK
ncbi:MAG: molybdopterin-guanine dinucleotide biosynthesis protein B [Candidatus Bathyarchaeota archaeon]|nr:molybdopterin-guanine dinucleotide biosynthesis protein B [Candidatus Bathyarchaeota archaeon]MDH5734345.1 molybdopterin-guanine dinucleotide biosynthesis protein B [Candidatus Bathyarchaeota archaeon]